MQLESKIEGLLFYKGEDVQIKKLAELLKVSTEEIEESLKKLELSLSGRGLVLVRKDDCVVLGITSELSPLIESIRKDEITKELTKSSLETLSIVLYKNGVSRSEIDYIRGVNSSFILRNLLVRGLVEKIMDPKDTRRILYRPTFDTLSFMGITSIEQLPKYNEVRTQLQEVIKQEETND
ncbi:MAG: SMC-Scp complex subunit ScpB [Candidatus Nomurabacteria bacterium]|nr:SMC-Scp complex subunit ScpB [Candidatus Nomurabacteria bacterium]